MWTTGQPGEGAHSSRGDFTTQEKLDRALVAGLILEVVLDQPNLPDGYKARHTQVKSRIQEYLVQYLAGRISLDRFRNLARNLDGWFDFYYPLLVSDSQPMGTKSPTVAYAAHEPQAAYSVKEVKSDWVGNTGCASTPPLHHACLDQLLDNWLEEAKTDIPHRSHRKLTPDKLRNFLCRSSGRWFRLRDFERFVQMDRKTAWDYLQLFLQTGLLCHNRKNSAAVRYCLAPSFLKVEADALRLAVSLTLSSYPEDLLEKTSDFLIASGGEPFQIGDWERELPASQSHLILEELVYREIVVWQNLPTGGRFLKLHHRWLQVETRSCVPKDQLVLYQQPSTADL
jgi:hypothetical protein